MEQGNTQPVAAIVLAAGEGRRLGAPKAIARLAGVTFLARVLATLEAARVRDVVVVVGAAAEEAIRSLAAPPRALVRHATWEAGRTSSLQAGLRGAPALRDALVFPVDHPLVQAATIARLLEAHAEHGEPRPAVTRPICGGRPGHPIILAARLVPEVLALGPDEPLYHVTRAHGALTLDVPVADEAIHLDVDTAEDLARAEALLRSRTGV